VVCVPKMTAILQTKNEDIEKMLIASTHNGTKNCEVLVEPYVWRTRTDDGTNIINLEKTWEKLQLAARIIAAIENPQDIIAFSKREYGHRAVLKFAEYTGARCEAGRWTPGQLTNQICQKYSEPRLLIVNDPLVDCNPIREASYVGIPVIAFVDTDSPLQYVDVAIPGNTRTQYSIPLLWYLLTREVKYLRGEIPRGRPWEVMVDLFFYRNPKELDKQEVPVATAPQGVPAETYDASGFEAPAYGVGDPQIQQGVADWGTGGDANAGWDDPVPVAGATPGATEDWGAALPETAAAPEAQAQAPAQVPIDPMAPSWDHIQPQAPQNPQAPPPAADNYGQDFVPQ